MPKAYLNNCIFYFSGISNPPIRSGDHLTIRYKHLSEIEQIANLAEKMPGLKKVDFISSDPEKSFEDFKSLYENIEAAGGLVKNKEGNFLLIHRNGMWDLPKGKLEKGESPESGAIREVEEECAVTGLTIKKFICHTFHTYKMDDRNFLKRTWWYEMETMFTGIPVPQVEEGISEVVWKTPDETEILLRQSYRSFEDISAWLKKSK